MGLILDSIQFIVGLAIGAAVCYWLEQKKRNLKRRWAKRKAEKVAKSINGLWALASLAIVIGVLIWLL